MGGAISPAGVSEAGVGEQVRKLRINSGMTQENLAEASGISLSVVRKIESRAGAPAWRPTMHSPAH
jgi:transcriptional regulator with XRE-family HTH domain